LQPVQVKTGITDGIYTEVTDGLSENDKVVTSAAYKQGGGASAQPASPFGGMRRF
jgi:HlyD family secretion protein